MTSPKITALNMGYLLADLSDWFRLPSDHPFSGQVEEMAMICYHIALPGQSVLVDVAAHQILPVKESDQPGEAYGASALIDQLRAANINPADITDVVITHAHSDHYSGLTLQVEDHYLPAFPNARHFLGIGDWQPEKFTELEQHTLSVIHQCGLLTLVEGELDLGDGLRILPSPGETPGHQILAVQCDEKEDYFVGDLFHHPLEFSEPERNGYWADSEIMNTSKEDLIKRASISDGLVYFSHLERPYRVEMIDQEVYWHEV